MMKKLLLTALTLLLISNYAFTQLSFSDFATQKKLPKPSKSLGVDIMKAFETRQSYSAFESTELSEQQLADLLWTAYGMNRQDGKLTAPTAQNSQDVQVYVCMKDGVWKYEPFIHELVQMMEDDIRETVDGRRPTNAPVIILLTADMRKYRGYQEGGDNKHYYEMGAVDCGIVSQNIAIFCAGAGLGTRPRAGMDQDAIRSALQLDESEILWLNLPVGIPVQ